MELTAHALLLDVAPFGERDALVAAFTREHGLLRGVAKWAFSRKQRGTYTVGNRVELCWRARLEEHLGTISCELAVPTGAMLLGERQRCYALQSLCALVLLGFEQRDPHPALFDALEKLLDALQFDLPWQADYARFEAVLLRETGFGLGLECCIATGSRSGLAYLSPKSGCAVSAEAGAPYHDKLFAYPTILIQEMHTRATPQEVAQALCVTGHFLHKWLLASLDKPMSASRGRLLAALAGGAKTVEDAR